MSPSQLLPYSSHFSSVDEYVDSLLEFSAASTIFQTLCGGVHILDFFTKEPSLYHSVIPSEWRSWLMTCPSKNLLDLLMRDDLSIPRSDSPPESLLNYIHSIRNHSLVRKLKPEKQSVTKLPRHVAVGMIPKKIHEVTQFADFVVSVADQVSEKRGKEITHFVDFGSGQNYLGRALASPPYNKNIIAVESKEINISGAKSKDVFAGVAEREKVRRNKKLFRALGDEVTTSERQLKEEKKDLGLVADRPKPGDELADLRPVRELDTIYTNVDGKGYIQYVSQIIKDGDLSQVISKIENTSAPSAGQQIGIGNDINTSLSKQPSHTMAISIHSCGNLSHHGIRSLLLNPSVHAIAIVGCCYNLLTTRFGSPTYKHPHLRPNLRPINAPPPTSTTPSSSSQDCNDEHGFPMSTLFQERDVTLNITSRMMAVQAPQNWSEKESDSFFTRHFYRALLQKVFLDYGVISILKSSDHPDSTEAVIIGSLHKKCYTSFVTYVRGALQKLSMNASSSCLSEKRFERIREITDVEIEEYESVYGERKRELSITWSLMAFSAGVVESLIVVDRWCFLREHEDVVGEAWVEAVFEYGLSPRNLVVVGIKR